MAQKMGPLLLFHYFGILRYMLQGPVTGDLDEQPPLSDSDDDILNKNNDEELDSISVSEPFRPG
jgi:hypothetical protein